MDAAKKIADQTQYLGFRIAEEKQAVGILRVEEIPEYDTITKVSGSPPSICGLITTEVRGGGLP